MTQVIAPSAARREPQQTLNQRMQHLLLGPQHKANIRFFGSNSLVLSAFTEAFPNLTSPLPHGDRRSPVQVQFESRTTEAVPLRDQCIDRLQFSLRRLNWLVPRARVLLSDVNGPRGGIDKRCQLEINTLSADRQVTEGESTVLSAALDQWGHVATGKGLRVTATGVRA